MRLTPKPDHSCVAQIISIAMAWLSLIPPPALAMRPLFASSDASGGKVEMPRSTMDRLGGEQTKERKSAASECLPLGQWPSRAVPGDAHEAQSRARLWGDITIAAPKIWRYERVDTYLDGLLRDIEGVSLADLTQLDPNSQNAGAIKFVQSALELGVQYNQALAMNNALSVQTWQQQSEQQAVQLRQYNANTQQLEAQRDSLITQQATALGTINHLQTLQAGGVSLSTEQNAQLSTAKDLVSTLNGELASVNTAIQNAGVAPAVPSPPTLQVPTVQGPASGTSMSSTFSSLTNLLSNLPSGIQNELTTALQSPSYPATKRLDSFITLLYERLSREVSALQDDLLRDPNNMAFLVQIDVGLYPGRKTKNHIARVEFHLDEKQCPGCKVYSIYPNQSSYNVANYQGESRSKSFWTNLGFLIGLGVSGAYRRQEDTLRGSLVQSVYTSGFQDDTTDARNGALHLQRFGWNYGPAPFENYISPGIRTTFAIISVPRQVISRSQKEGETPRGLISRVLQQGSDATSKSENGVTTSTVTSGTVITTEIHDASNSQREFNFPDGAPSSSCFDLAITAYWGLRDNPFFNHPHIFDTEPADDDRSPRESTLAKTITVELPGTAGLDELPAAIRVEPGQLHVTSMEYNSVYTGVPADTPSGGSTNGSSALSPSGPLNYSTNTCTAGRCTAVVLAISERIDPNLVVTVNGAVLTRVRDWRGRATSILPAPQSGSDSSSQLASGATGTPSPTQPERLFRSAPGILESDLMGPNTWYALDSHRILLTISKDIVPEEEFPIIRLADPSKKVLTLPAGLDQGFSEIEVNGFHLAARTAQQLGNRVKTRYPSLGPFLPVVVSEPVQGGGPYPSATFIPLFLHNPAKADVYAYLGQTGKQVLIGFPESQEGRIFHKWLPANDQVILEDRNLDLAWALDCFGQGNDLVCDIPRREIANAYRTVSSSCGSTCSAHETIADLPFVSSMQLWIEQYDPEGEDAFYTASPASLGLFPLYQNNNVEDTPYGFDRWHFQDATEGQVTVSGCGYEDYLNNSVKLATQVNLVQATNLRILGSDANDAYPTLSYGDCVSFKVPARTLVKNEIVLVPVAPRSDAVTGMTTQQKFDFRQVHPVKAPIIISTSTLRPFFGRPKIIANWSDPNKKGPYQITSWTLEFSAGRLDWNDKLSTTDGMLAALRIECPDSSGQPNSKIQCGLNSVTPNNPLSVCNWDELSRQGKLVIRMNVKRSDVYNLPDEIPVLRDNFVVATLRIPELLFPHELKFQQISSTQFVLRGPSANVLDAVSLQGSGSYTVRTSVGADFALVNLEKNSSSPSNSAAKSADARPLISSVTIDTSGKNLTIQGQNFGSHIGAVKVDGVEATISQAAAPKITRWTDQLISVEISKTKTAGDTVKLQVIDSQMSSDVAAIDFDHSTKADCDGSVVPCIVSVVRGKAEEIQIAGQNFGNSLGEVTIDGKRASLSEWTPTAIEATLPDRSKSVVKIKVTVARMAGEPGSYIVVAESKTTDAAASNGTGSAPSARSGSDAASTSVPPGTYAVIGLIQTGGTTSSPEYMPLEFKDSQGKPLVFTVPKPAPASSNAGANPPSSTKTITITKSTSASGNPNQSDIQKPKQ